MTTNAKLAFGVEFEVLLKPKEEFIAELELICPEWAAKFEQAKEAESGTAAEENTSTCTSTGTTRAGAAALRLPFRQQLAILLTNDEIPAAITSSNYREWSVVDEPTLDEVPGYCRVELVSRAMASDDEWQKELDRVFKRLDLSFDMMCTTGCSMHVHVSPSAKPEGQREKWTFANLNKIMKTLSYFTSSVNKIMPAERKKNPWAMQNMLSDDVAKAKPQLTNAYAQVQTETWKPLFDIYDSQMKRPLDKRQAFAIMGHCRYVAWNFEHITDACGTVEFRQCPGVMTSAKAKHWTIFTLGFLYAAAFQTNLNWAQLADQNTHPSVEDLDSSTKAGVGGLESTCQGALEGLKEDTNKAKVWSAEETKEILKKKALQDEHGSPGSFPEKFERTPHGTPTGSPSGSPSH